MLYGVARAGKVLQEDMFMGKKILIKNAQAIVTCDESDTIYYDADMLVDGPSIVAIGKNIDRPYDETIDAAGMSTTRLTGNQTTSDGITRPATMG